MQISKTLAAALAAAALTAIAGSPALASPSKEAGFTYRASPAAANPKDVFRHNIRVAAPEAKTEMAMKNCGCPMMKAPASTSAHGG
ncbi:hypothetical protein CFHF_07630 [Caulobacter flavus]|jgi:hypothetical protein|uniref:Uncharacterized protein n=1 Tax=Caulobacter flavus TaxID=1679497 RepID=A0A2N5CVZ1_9CAUL|nr:hypothetical protein [Caulobacter flavus]AYV48208.1 hypothetical protein C1707_19160 [Caulobacter flavus]PLR17960.1 hypothetical protein CFHF_07630 [Caulobacter flavus]